jgi:16S rRNA processing protein RimM
VSLKRVWLWDGAEKLREAEVRSCRLTSSRGGQALFQFTCCNSIDDAQALVGWHVQIPLSERLPLAHGQYYITDLEGCTVREKSGAGFDGAMGSESGAGSGQILGEVAYVQETGEKAAGTPVLVVRSAEKELLIPLAAEICIRIDPAAREIVVRLPQGLRELNDPRLPAAEDPGTS